MAKILLVEDDNNLREIFEMRLQADGYQTVTAGNGEEGLTVAMKEKPDLIIADVMMPKLSGFDMLENLRAVPEMKDVKVIMMTALGQAEDRSRGESLGVIKYLVKSQATLEDFARTVSQVLPPSGAGSQATPQPQVTQNNQQGRITMQNDQPDQPTNQSPAGDAGAPTENAGMPPAATPTDPTGMPPGATQDPSASSDDTAGSAPAEPTTPEQPMGGDAAMGGSSGMGMPAEPAAGSTVTPSEPAADPATPDPMGEPTTPPAPSDPAAPSTPDNSGSL